VAAQETEPQPVSFMSRKLSGVQQCNNARIVEALAEQIALTIWRTNLLGVQFYIYSDHDSFKQTTQTTPLNEAR